MTFSKSRDTHKFFPFFFFPHVGSHRVVCIFLGGFCFLFSLLVKEFYKTTQIQPNAVKLNAKQIYATRSEARWWASSSYCWLLRNGEEQRAPHESLKPDPERGHSKPTHTHTLTATHTEPKKPRKTRQTVENGLPSFLVVLRVTCRFSFSLDSFWILTAPDGTTDIWIIHGHTSEWIIFLLCLSAPWHVPCLFIGCETKKELKKRGRRLFVPPKKNCLKKITNFNFRSETTTTTIQNMSAPCCLVWRRPLHHPELRFHRICETGESFFSLPAVIISYHILRLSYIQYTYYTYTIYLMDAKFGTIGTAK